MSEFSITDEAMWKKSSYSSKGECVEIATLSRDAVAMRNSNSPGKEALVFNMNGMAAFVKGIKAGEFDDLAE